MPNDAALIGLDWGTTSMRAYLLDARGAILQQRRGAWGIRNVPDRDFAGLYAQATDGWDAALPALACGMIGSRNGWHEAPYCDAPAGLDALAACLARVPGAALSIVPGVRTVDRHGDPDVMRGEETQLVGALSPPRADALFVHPGTHCKWARLRAGRIAAFATWMTGELHAVLLGHSILGAALPAPREAAAPEARAQDADAAGADWSAFDRGVARANADADFLHGLFTARSRMLEAGLQPAQVPEYLSGLLIGEEIRGARAAGWLARGARPVLIGEPSLVARHARAFTQLGVPFERGPHEAAPAGLLAIARAAGLVG